MIIFKIPYQLHLILKTINLQKKKIALFNLEILVILLY